MYTSFLRYMRVRLEDAERCPSWPKEHDWKSCIPQKGIRGSNPRLSATFQPPCGEVAERLNAAVSKTVLPVNPVTRVRIPASPPVQLTSQPGTFFIPVDIAWIRTVRSISVKRTAQWAVRRKSARRLQPKRVIFREAENTESLPLRHLDFKSPCRAIFHSHAARRPCAPSWLSSLRSCTEVHFARLLSQPGAPGRRSLHCLLGHSSELDEAATGL